MSENLNSNEIQQAISVCLDEIIKLKEENASLKQQVNLLVDANASLNRTFEEMAKQTSKYITYLDFAVDNVRYEANDPNFANKLFFPKFYPLEYTISRLVEGASLSRFGDGEFAIMSNVPRPRFQQNDAALAQRLIDVISRKDDDLLIGIADNYGELSKYNNSGVQGIRTYMTDKTRSQHRSFLSEERTYHNAYITRPYALYKDNNTDAPQKRFNALKEIWNNRNVIFVEGFQTRLGYKNDLFNNASSIRRIECPSENAFSRYDDILSACLNSASRNDLFIIALGPTATVLAYDIFSSGYQAVDLGHLDLEYEWFMNGSGTRSKVTYKYNNEFTGGNVVDDINDPEFDKQIIARLY